MIYTQPVSKASHDSFVQGTGITTILASALFDKNEWETPDTFSPEHFLNPEGQFRRRDAFLPFSAGLFSTLSAMLSVLLIATNIIHNRNTYHK